VPRVQNKERILMVVIEKHQVTYKGKPIRVMSDFSEETLKIRRSWTDVVQDLKQSTTNKTTISSKVTL
jgi:hypothetical protein